MNCIDCGKKCLGQRCRKCYYKKRKKQDKWCPNITHKSRGCVSRWKNYSTKHKRVEVIEKDKKGMSWKGIYTSKNKNVWGVD